LVVVLTDLYVLFSGGILILGLGGCFGIAVVPTVWFCCCAVYLPSTFQETTAVSQFVSKTFLRRDFSHLRRSFCVLFLEFGCDCSMSLVLVFRRGCFCTAVGWWFSFQRTGV
jgi:hypothetical protein